MKGKTPMKKLEQGAWLLMALGVVAGCADIPDVRDSPLPHEETGSPPSSGQQAVEIPGTARVIEDASTGRFLIAASEASRPYVMGFSVRCEGGAAVRDGSRLSCQGAARPQVTHLYIPLEGAAADQADAAILRAPAVSLTPVQQREAVACKGAPSAEFRRLMQRYTEDLGAIVTQQASRPVLVLLEYQGSRAYGSAPAGQLGLGSEVSAYNTELLQEEGGISCRCNTAGSCPKDGQWPAASWCDATNCKSCTMN